MSEERHVVAIIGGAVAGSEAAALCAERGALAVVFEQGRKPYGKIEDGLPRWHEKLREKEYERIDENLGRAGVRFVPNTKIGSDVSFEELQSLGFSAIILANGAWRDRPLAIGDVDDYIGRGFLYQNALVQWFNHKHERGYRGPQLEIPEGAIVVGGGLASIDVVKILSLETHARALRARGHDVDIVDLEVRGIPAWAQKHGVDLAELGVRPPTLYYRRRKEDMPLASPPDNADEAQIQKTQKARAKILDRVIERYCVRFEGNQMPVRTLTEGGRLVGLVFQKTELDGGKLRPIPGAETEVRAPLVVSSIGSIPEPIPGVPMQGELYDFADWTVGTVRDREGVFGLGNVLTGKGNIKESRANAQVITRGLLDEYLQIDAALSEFHAEARAAAAPVVEKALAGPDLDDRTLARIDAWVGARWRAVAYDGDYTAWVTAAKEHS